MVVITTTVEVHLVLQLQFGLKLIGRKLFPVICCRTNWLRLDQLTMHYELKPNFILLNT